MSASRDIVAAPGISRREAIRRAALLAGVAFAPAWLSLAEGDRAAAHRNSFSALTTAQQDDLLRGIARAEEGQPQGFFRLFRSATILGYFTSETVGKTVLHYDPVPGRYDGCLPIAEVGNRNWTT